MKTKAPLIIATLAPAAVLGVLILLSLPHVVSWSAIATTAMLFVVWSIGVLAVVHNLTRRDRANAPWPAIAMSAGLSTLGLVVPLVALSNSVDAPGVVPAWLTSVALAGGMASSLVGSVIWIMRITPAAPSGNS